jgi:hypothetical protein
MDLLIVVVVLIALFGSGPWYPYSRAWGYRPFNGLLIILLIVVLVLLLTGNFGSVHRPF